MLRDSPGNPWQSGLLDAGGRVKPAWYRFSGAARPVDGQDPLVPPDEDSVLVPALELAYHNAAGTKVTIDVTFGATSVGYAKRLARGADRSSAERAGRRHGER